MANRPSIEQVRQLKRERGWELMKRYGAHALGVGRSEEGEGPAAEPALLFYVERKEEAEVRTRVIESPQAQLEAD